MGVPETGEQQNVGGWITIQPGLPDVFTDVLQTIQSLLSALLAILNILLAVLQIVKAFIVGLLDPLVAIIEAVINEIESLLNDIRQIGIYLSGDFDLDPPTFASILGGFSAYERRMVGRLVNQADPTRPNFSTRTAGIAIFLYVSADTTGVGQLVSIVQRIAAFFGRKAPVRVTSVAVGLQVAYGAEGAAPSTFGTLAASFRVNNLPNQAIIRWQMAGGDGLVRWLQPAPKGFLLEVSTVPDGLLLAYDTYAKNATVGSEQNIRIRGLMRDPKTGLPFHLYGGPDLIDAGNVAGGTYDPDNDGTNRETRLYAYRSSADNVPIPLGTLKTADGRYLLQRTFFVKAGFLSTYSPGQGWAATIDAADMPWEAEFANNNGTIEATPVGDGPASTVFVRVTQVTEKIADAVVTTNGVGKTGPLSTPLNLWTVTAEQIASSAVTTGSVLFNTPVYSPDDRGEPSAALEVTFPPATSIDYLNTLTAALAVVVLSRSDLPVAETGLTFAVGRAASATGLEEVSRFLVPQLIKDGKNPYYNRQGVAPEDFRKDLLRRCRTLAQFLYTQTGPLGSLEATAVSVGAPLLSFKWSDADAVLPNLTILDSLANSDVGSGLALNPFSVGYNTAAVTTLYLGKAPVFIDRGPAFLQKSGANETKWVVNQGSADLSPVVYSLLTFRRIVFCRNALTSDVYGAAAGVLNIAASVLTLRKSPESGAWTTFRLFPQGLPPVEAALDEILKFVKAIAAGVKGFTDILVGYIEFLQARILELEALIIRIQGLVLALSGFALPAVSGLVVTGNGTAGLVSGLVTAANKPSDNATTTEIAEATYGTYGAGLVLVAGGLPTVLVELLQAFFPEAD